MCISTLWFPSAQEGSPRKPFRGTCRPPLPLGITLRLQGNQKWLHTAGCGFSHAFHSFLCCITHCSDVGVALLSGGINCRNHITGRADQCQVSQLIYYILSGKKKAIKHENTTLSLQHSDKDSSSCLFETPSCRTKACFTWTCFEDFRQVKSSCGALTLTAGPS